jgi:hypothetical protein
MSYTLTQQQVDTLQEASYKATGVEIRSYSGRCMYGDYCLGIVLETGELFSFAITLQKLDPTLAELLADSRARWDSMGRDKEIVYWESIKVTGTDLADSDDEEVA